MTDQEDYREKLSEKQYRILFKVDTEPPGSGEYIDKDDEGVYRCVACGQELFDSDTKLESDEWPSFYDAKEGSVRFKGDLDDPVNMTEVVCSNCGGHLGHVFPDGPEPTGKRYCINSAVLDFEES